ncbi:MAG: serine/threonine protein kinase [Candidatus Nitrotoga sp. LAW]|nr:MAG: serine/threonine protein kinase [Candidatus Nitrotoga sp. LAW]
MTGPHVAGDLVDDRYEVIDYVNEGGMQFVYAAKDTILDRVVALKTPKNTSALKRFNRSAIVSAKVNHPNIAKTLDYFECDEKPYLIEEFIQGSDLQNSFLKKIKFLDPYLAARVFHHLAKGIAAAHHVKVIHRDLKPSNVMVSDDPQFSVIKITDFGIAKMAGEELTEVALGGVESITASQTAIGALPYMAPEAIETPKDVDLPADVWSVGAMMYEVITGEKPFGMGLIAVSKIMSANLNPFPSFLTSNPQFSPLSTKLIELIVLCLQKNPNKRPSADKLVELCSTLYYPVSERHEGVVANIKYNSWGFIKLNSQNVFFNFDSVYGTLPKVGDRVVFSMSPGSGANRAHPIIRLIPEASTA